MAIFVRHVSVLLIPEVKRIVRILNVPFQVCKLKLALSQLEDSWYSIRNLQQLARVSFKLDKSHTTKVYKVLLVI